MDELSILTRRVESLERRSRWTSVLAGILAAIVLIIVIAVEMRKPPDVLHARGIIITDAAGKTRIVVGAPMLNAIADTKLAQSVGMTVLDSSGRLAVSIGANNPAVLADGKTFKRIGEQAGINIYDPRNGGERGGMGVFDDGRVNICLDYSEKPKEAVCMSVGPKDAHASVALNGTPENQRSTA